MVLTGVVGPASAPVEVAIPKTVSLEEAALFVQTPGILVTPKTSVGMQEAYCYGRVQACGCTSKWALWAQQPLGWPPFGAMRMMNARTAVEAGKRSHPPWAARPLQIMAGQVLSRFAHQEDLQCLLCCDLRCLLLFHRCLYSRP